MSIRNLIILSQLNPPAQRNHVLVRERVTNLLNSSLTYPLTLLQAGTGYGKSTALISFINKQDLPVYWYTVAPTDRDAILFLVNLFSAFNQHDENIGTEALRILEMPEATQQEALIALINTLETCLENEVLFIMDDFHHVRDVSEIMRLVDWMVDHLPKQVHLLISTRRSLDFNSLNKWRVKGSVFEINRKDLSFDQKEISDLFEKEYNVKLNPQEIQQLHEKTEGWAIGLQMVWQSLQGDPERCVQKVLEDNPDSRKALFAYLAEEVLGRLEPDIQEFLLRTAILSELDGETCDFLMLKNNSIEVLKHLNTSGLFIEELRPSVYRYHYMFREFLLNHLYKDQHQTQELHHKIASYFSAHQYWERAISHLISAADYHQVNQILEDIGEKMIQDGRQESISYWIHKFPEAIRQNYPYINFLLGEVNRYASHFELALENYHSAERLYRAAGNKWGVSLVLRGQARVYLDTIRPLNADQLLKDALELLDPHEDRKDVADLLTLIAENQLNLGYPNSAEEYLAQAKQLRREIDSENGFIMARVLLRTGRLDEGIQLLETHESNYDESNIARPQRFHREASLLLSLFYAFKGNLPKTDLYARRGIKIGEQLQSNFVQSVGYMRLGHALQMSEMQTWSTQGYEQAIQYYEQSIKKVDVVRIHVEPLWGICRALGYSGRIHEAEGTAREALAIAKNAGDEWISILIRISLGAGEFLAGNYEAAHQALTIAESTAIKVEDPFSLCAARLWLALNAWKQGFTNSTLIYLEKLLPLIKEHHYEFLLTQETLLGLSDSEAFIPLLIEARNNGIQTELVSTLLAKLNAESLTYHPGYTLWIRTFGGFNIWRSKHLIQPNDWKREKSRQLLQLLSANKGKWIHRNRISDALWPDVAISTAANNLKVTLNALNQVIEPDRPRGKASFFIERRHEQYRLNPIAKIVLDSELFESFIEENTISSLEKAVQLYQGHYFSNEYVQEWLVAEEQYYHQQYLTGAEKLIDHYIQSNALEKALNLSLQILTKDNLWEPAYRSQMRIYRRMGNDLMVHSVFQQCQQTFKRYLDSDVSPETTLLYDELLGKLPHKDSPSPEG